MRRVKDRFGRLLDRPATVDISRYQELLKSIEWREAKLEKLTDEELTAAAAALRTEESDEDTGHGKGHGKDDKGFDEKHLAELCAVGREAARRALGERPYDVQLLGVMELLAGHVVQMATGEGKTLAGALAAAGYALQGKPVHVMSVNDYLARRDAEWMGPVYELLGVSVGWVSQTSTAEERRAAYAKEVTYGSVSEIGFDLLRDRLCTDVEEMVGREPGVVLVDEADSVLIDEAKVPLVLAGSSAEAETDPEVAKIVRTLRPGAHYERDEDGRNAWLTSRGAKMVEKALGGVDLYSGEHSDRLAAVNAALHAHALLERDVDYIVRDGKVHLINSSRGRIALMQRWPDGLQAAVEAKERLRPTESGEVLDSISVQGLIGRYPVVCGMTGTAVAVAEQLREFYQLRVAVIPPNTECVREDEPDRLYDTVEAKEAAIVAQIAETHATGRPILIGTRDVAESERLAKMLDEAEVPCVVLNAKNDAEEAAIVAEAGAFNAVTVSTQMAGRGTDIRLGGKDGADHAKVAELGGLLVIGTGRYQSSRLDDQLRGRSGRQGDPGGSVMFASLGDDQVLQYAPDATAGAPPDDEGRLTDPTTQRFVDHAQKVSEGVQLEIHRNTWRYTRLIEHQRRALLEHRDELLTTDLAATELAALCPDRWSELAEEWDADVLERAARQVMLYHLDERWTEHLAFLADVRETIHLRALAKETPIDEFHRTAIPVFKQIPDEIGERAAETFTTVEITTEGAALEQAGLRRPSSTWTYMVHDNPFDTDAEQALQRVRAMIKKVRGGARR
ncbi:accessory Sec system translocase SecA2 [Actinophytocola xanthii]|uniref:Protein translocase subunit SecA n=1 Tax=Actinophytocola xanthii TaxID=1912961 RepID=A0A1Q8C3H6_9PSEU|nr:accessory Sec system translocase SecA2 [Actinophytocola xanthii]OLF08917.1 accessory Sec system translocase SecA2 [Actinophytocola xanthii]